MRKWKFAKVDFIPFQYNPVSRKLTLIESVVLKISYIQSPAKLDENLMADTVMDDIAPEIFLNYDEASDWYEPKLGTEPRATYDYVIITTNLIKTNSAKLSSFIAHKQSLGHTVLVVTEDDFGGLKGQEPNQKAEKIREWLKNNYFPKGIEYVLLIGDPNPYSERGEGDIPMKMCWPRYAYTTYRESPTDYFYADLTGNWDINGDQIYGQWDVDYPVSGGVDFTPEVFVGRIPVYSAAYATLDNILQKIIDYETAGTVSWRKSILMPMGFQYPIGGPGGGPYDGAPLGEQMRDDYLNANSYTSWRMYQQGNGTCGLDSINTSEQELTGGTVVRDRWAANDYGIVCWWGHGSTTTTIVGYGYYQEYQPSPCNDGLLFQSSYCSSLDDNHPAFTYQCSCTNGYPENSDNLQYAILKRGGIATVGATRASFFFTRAYGHFDGSTGNEGIGYEYVKRLVQELPGGKALYLTKMSMDPSQSKTLMNWYDFNLYGDPEVSLKKTQPVAQEDYGVFRAGKWFIDTDGDHVADESFWYGIAGDVPLVGDINQDGKDDTIIFRNGKWFVDMTGDHIADESFWYGIAGDVPLVGDINQDGTDDTIIFRNGKWFVDMTGDHIADESFWYGIAGDVPLVGDINQDGTDDTIIFRNGKWYVDTDYNHVADERFWYGTADDVPLVGDINQDRTDDTIIFRNGKWYVDTDYNHVADLGFWYGTAGDKPVVGDIG
jgi:hypothetical protein